MQCAGKQDSFVIVRNLGPGSNDLLQLLTERNVLVCNYILVCPTSMPSEMKPRFVLLYGSQKGQAQAIAEGLAEEAEGHGLFAELSCLENNEKVTIAIILARLHSNTQSH